MSRRLINHSFSQSFSHSIIHCNAAESRECSWRVPPIHTRTCESRTSGSTLVGWLVLQVGGLSRALIAGCREPVESQRGSRRRQRGISAQEARRVGGLEPIGSTEAEHHSISRSISYHHHPRLHPSTRTPRGSRLSCLALSWVSSTRVWCHSRAACVYT